MKSFLNWDIKFRFEEELLEGWGCWGVCFMPCTWNCLIHASGKKKDEKLGKIEKLKGVQVK